MKGWLVLRRRDSLWGVPQAALRELSGGQPPRLELRSGTTLVADELLAASVELEPRPIPPSALPYCGGQISRLAVWSGRPVVLFEGEVEPPACLIETDEAKKEIHGDETR